LIFSENLGLRATAGTQLMFTTLYNQSRIIIFSKNTVKVSLMICFLMSRSWAKMRVKMKITLSLMMIMSHLRLRGRLLQITFTSSATLRKAIFTDRKLQMEALVIREI